MNEAPNFEPFRISNLDEARLAMRRPKGSFEEWLECAQIFSAKKLWVEFETAAQKTLEAAVNRPIKPPMLKQAAMNYAAASLKTFSSKSEFEENCIRTKIALNKFSNELSKKSENMKTYFDCVIEAIDEIMLLLSDGSPQALVSISSRLRKRLARPDLAVEVANIAIRDDPKQFAAYVTRGSALSELEDFTNAAADFLTAESDIKARPFALAGYTKLLVRQGQFGLAFNIGSELLERRPTKPILYLLAAAAKGSKDDQQFDELVRRADSLPDSEPGTGRLILLRQSILILIENRQFEVANRLIQELATLDKPGKVSIYQSKLRKAQISTTL